MRIAGVCVDLRPVTGAFDRIIIAALDLPLIDLIGIEEGFPLRRSGHVIIDELMAAPPFKGPCLLAPSYSERDAAVRWSKLAFSLRTKSWPSTPSS